jgi:hypothetical protein
MPQDPRERPRFCGEYRSTLRARNKSDSSLRDRSPRAGLKPLRLVRSAGFAAGRHEQLVGPPRASCRTGVAGFLRSKGGGGAFRRGDPPTHAGSDSLHTDLANGFPPPIHAAPAASVYPLRLRYRTGATYKARGKEGELFLVEIEAAPNRVI